MMTRPSRAYAGDLSAWKFTKCINTSGLVFMAGYISIYCASWRSHNWYWQLTIKARLQFLFTTSVTDLTASGKQQVAIWWEPDMCHSALLSLIHTHHVSPRLCIDRHCYTHKSVTIARSFVQSYKHYSTAKCFTRSSACRRERAHI